MTMLLADQHVLIVEDEIFIALELVNIIRDAGAEVVGPALSAEHALRLIESHAVTAAILDVTLGNGNSLAVAQRLKALDVPFVFHTGNPGYLASARGWPKAPVVNKPVAADELLHRLETCLK